MITSSETKDIHSDTKPLATHFLLGLWTHWRLLCLLQIIKHNDMPSFLNTVGELEGIDMIETAASKPIITLDPGPLGTPCVPDRQAQLIKDGSANSGKQMPGAWHAPSELHDTSGSWLR